MDWLQKLALGAGLESHFLNGHPCLYSTLYDLTICVRILRVCGQMQLKSSATEMQLQGKHKYAKTKPSTQKIVP